MNILIVDDEPGSRLMVSSAVRRLGHEAVEAEDGDDGWQRFQAGRPEVLITDWSMPGLDGTELTRRIRSLEGGGYTYIMVLSARADEYAQRDAVRAGADDVLAKPLDPAELERGLIAAERLVTMHRRMTSDLRRDPVTGAGSRVRLDEDLAALCARATRYGHTYCVAMIGLVPGSDDGVRRVGAALTRRSAPATCSTATARRSSSCSCPSRGWRRRTWPRTGCAPPPSRPPRPGRRSASGSSRRATEPEPAALLAAAEATLTQAATQAGGVLHGGGEGGGACGCSWPTTTPCRGSCSARSSSASPTSRSSARPTTPSRPIELALRRRPDIVLLDVNMPGGGGARAAVEIREGLPDVKIVAISADDSQGSQYDMMRAGAVGFIAKGSPDDEILRVFVPQRAGSRIARGDARGVPRRRSPAARGAKSPVMRARRRSRTSR